MKRTTVLASLVFIALLPGIAAAHPAVNEMELTGIVRHDVGHPARHHHVREGRQYHHVAYPHHGGRHVPIPRRRGHSHPPQLRIEIVL